MHLAIIPDGNRRWARAQGLFPWKGHEKAINNFRDLTEWCRQSKRVSTLTVWCFSTENWKRDRKEINYLMGYLEDFLNKERGDFLKKHIKFLHSGRKDRIPPSLAQLIEDVERQTADQKEFTLHLAVDYGGKDEILRAISKISDPKSTTEESLHALFDQPDLPDIDLIIRTSGELRTSGFFIWQAAYAEWIFLQKHFPELTTDDLAAAVEELDNRQRRFGA